MSSDLSNHPNVVVAIGEDDCEEGVAEMKEGKQSVHGQLLVGRTPSTHVFKLGGCTQLKRACSRTPRRNWPLLGRYITSVSPPLPQMVYIRPQTASCASCTPRVEFNSPGIKCELLRGWSKEFALAGLCEGDISGSKTARSKNSAQSRRYTDRP